MVDSRLELFTGDTGGIDSWLTGDNASQISQRLEKMPGEPLSYALLNQLLALSQQPAVSRAFFDYYWCSALRIRIGLKIYLTIIRATSASIESYPSSTSDGDYTGSMWIPFSTSER